MRQAVALFALLLLATLFIPADVAGAAQSSTTLPGALLSRPLRSCVKVLTGDSQGTGMIVGDRTVRMNARVVGTAAQATASQAQPQPPATSNSRSLRLKNTLKRAGCWGAAIIAAILGLALLRAGIRMTEV